MESLTCDLFALGMTSLHRAGLGGLVSTLRWIEKSLPDNERPPGQWTVDERSVTFGWEEAEAKLFFDRLFSLAFQIQEGLIYLPGQYGELAPRLEVRAALHDGLLSSFYGHGKSRGRGERSEERTYEIDEYVISLSYSPVSWYSPQRDGSSDVIKSLKKPVEVKRHLYPGAMQRHAAYPQSLAKQGAHLVLPLWFAPVGTISLKTRGKDGKKNACALLIPDLQTLLGVEHEIQGLLPETARDCQVDSVADAALQAKLRLRMRNMLDSEKIAAIRCILFYREAWNTKMTAPSMVLEVENATTDIGLDQFETAIAALPPPAPRPNMEGKYFWPKSYIRPLIAENLALGRLWYAGFSQLMTAQDSGSHTPIRNYLYSERKGLSTMTEEIQWDHPGEKAIVRAVHEAMRCRYGRIAAENARNQAAMKNRMTREYERQRLAFAGAKTVDALRHALADLWSRAGSNSVLREAWPKVLPLLSDEKWQLTRDLALIALASYQGKEQENIDLTKTETDEGEEQQ
ncbi:MAG: type I-MYXAN CRISPR-associated Cas8a1/Cmx1 [Nitrospira sp.]|nr:type I-MYXAN CRISPR-associated Cas8a1/Cmx1 [Nitrospira sp.]